MILELLKLWMSSKASPMNVCVRYDKTKMANLGKRRNV